MHDMNVDMGGNKNSHKAEQRGMSFLPIFWLCPCVLHFLAAFSLPPVSNEQFPKYTIVGQGGQARREAWTGISIRAWVVIAAEYAVVVSYKSVLHNSEIFQRCYGENVRSRL